MVWSFEDHDHLDDSVHEHSMQDGQMQNEVEHNGSEHGSIHDEHQD